MVEVTKKNQMKKIRAFEKGFYAVHLINIGSQLGIFEELNSSKNGLTISEAASKLKLHEPYLEIWFQTAYFFEILDCDPEGRFYFQPYLNEILGDKSSINHYCANINLSVEIGFECLTRNSIPLYQNGERFIAYNKGRIAKNAYATTQNVPLIFLFMIFPQNKSFNDLMIQGAKFLDIGCGNGNLITQLAQNYITSEFVGVNPDINGIQIAEQKIKEVNLEDRVSVLNIGAEELDYNEEFDIANMVLTLHEIIPEIRHDVIKSAYNALRPGGHLLILDFPYPSKIEDFRKPKYEYGIIDQFFESVSGARHLNTIEQEKLLTKVGFKNIQRTNIVKGMLDFTCAVKT